MIAESELVRTFESKNNLKIKANHHRGIGDECFWERISL